MRRRAIRGWVIRLSWSPAIPTYYAVDRDGVYYAASVIHHALIYPLRADAEAVNRRRRLKGVIESGPE